METDTWSDDNGDEVFLTREEMADHFQMRYVEQRSDREWRWAVKVLDQWRKSHNSRRGGRP